MASSRWTWIFRIEDCETRNTEWQLQHWYARNHGTSTRIQNLLLTRVSFAVSQEQGRKLLSMIGEQTSDCRTNGASSGFSEHPPMRERT